MEINEVIATTGITTGFDDVAVSNQSTEVKLKYIL
jgi:hypothetical protein